MIGAVEKSRVFKFGQFKGVFPVEQKRTKSENASFRSWLMAYEFLDGNKTETGWATEFNAFRLALRNFWRAQGVETGWEV